MSYFPEGIMPSRAKDESQDVKGIKHIISSADFNKHDEEIRAIQRYLGARRPSFPASGLKVTATPGAGGPADECSVTPQDIVSVLGAIADKINRIKSEMVFVTSGIVRVKDPAYPSADGSITFPSNWPTTTLTQAISDDTTSDEDPSEDLESVELADVSDLPEEGGYVTIINDSSMITYTGGDEDLVAVGNTSLATASDPIYDQSGVSVGDVDNKERVFGLGSNVEVLEYSSIDESSKLLLGVKRKRLGTSSTRHSSGDTVFKGRLSIGFYPVNYKLTDQKMDQVDCVLRSDGRIDLRVRGGGSDDTVIAYVQYNAVLMREMEPLSMFSPGDFGNCPSTE
jgi:hypothetical protein